MIDRTIGWCVENRALVLAAAIAAVAGGFWAMQRAPLDALPDLSDVQVVVVTDWAGRSPDLIEDQVTFPIVSALLPTPKVRSVRGFTDFGVSYVYVIFDDGADIYWARNRVLEHLQRIRGTLPPGVTPALAPDASGAGWVFEYALIDESGRHTLDELRSLQDWVLRYRLGSIPGVAEVASIGGFVKQYQVNLDPTRLAAYGVSAKQVVDAIRASNNDVEGRLLEFAGREYMIRARGYLTSVADIEAVALGADAAGTAVRVADVAHVRIGPDFRRGVAELDGRGEVVGGIVVMRFDENALRVIDQVKARLAELQRTLPPGILIVPTYDRGGLIRGSVRTLVRLLLEGVIVVSLALVLFLSHPRSALVPVLALPVAVISAFIPIWYFGISLNIMSLGGLALAIGVLVDGSIVMVENCYRRLVEERSEPGDRWLAMVAASRQVARPVFFSLAVIVVSFAPVFLLEGQEGRLFQPLALTKTFAMVAATVLALTLVPALIAALLVPGVRAEPRAPNWLTRVSTAIYAPVLRLALRWKWSVLLANAAVVPLTLALMMTLGHEFMPPLYEGSILYMPTAAPGLPVSEATRLIQQQDRLLRAFPEVERVFGTAGRSTAATDNSPLSMVNTIVTLKPRDAWRPGMTFERLQHEMDGTLQFAGVPNTWTQPIRGRLDMLSTGIKSPVGIKVLGADSKVIQDLGIAIERILRGVPGTRSVYAERVADGYFADIRIDRAAIARYGITVEDVEAVVQTAIGGANIGQTIEGRERYPINVRYQQDFRDDLAALARVLVKVPRGQHIPLGQLAEVVVTTGPAMIRDENGRLAGYVYVDTDTTELGDYVARARAAIDTELKLPPGYAIDWSGQYELLLRAAARLRVIVPTALLAIFALLYLTFRSASEALIVMLSVLYAMTGGAVVQWLLGYNFSVAVWIGYITLYGVAIQTGVIMVVYLHEALERRAAAGRLADEQDLYEATVAGAVLRLRPKLMTMATTIGGLLPIMWSSGVGSDLMKPIAAPIIGGMLTSAVHVLLITPIIFFLMKRRALSRGRLTLNTSSP